MPLQAAKKLTTDEILEMARQAVELYQFDRADSLLRAEQQNLKKRRRSNADIDRLLEQIQHSRILLHATERVTIIDSLVCDRNQVLQTIKMSKDAGRLDTYARTFQVADSMGCTIFENELANKRYISVPAPDGTLRLATSDRIGQDWSEPILLEGLNDDEAQNYPFLLSDGITLYYAATGDESIGGYDIFVTRTDGDDDTCLSPENIGFPFNSPYNDYLYAIDEMNELGFFVSDRYQPADKVCIYIFVPNATREVYGDDVTADQLSALARIASIADTQTDPDIVAQARQRLQDLREGRSATQTVAADFYFVINDQKTYTSISDFRSAAAKAKMQQWMTLNKSVETDRAMLTQLRDTYATAQPASRRQLGQTITRIETTIYTQMAQRDALAKEIRNLEIRAL